MKGRVIQKLVTKICIHDRDFVYIIDDKQVYYNGRLIYTSEKSLQEIYSDQVGRYYTNTIYGDGLVIDPVSNSVKFLEKKNVKYLSREIAIFSIKPNTLIENSRENTKFQLSFRLFNYLVDNGQNLLINYFQDENLISVFSLRDGALITEYQLSSLGLWLNGSVENPYHINSFCGSHNSTLVCSLNSGDILLLNVQNSKNYRLINEAKFPRKLYPKEKAEHIYAGLFGRRYIEVDIITGQIVVDSSIEEQLRNIKNIPSEQPCWFSVGFSVFYKNLFYFLCDNNFVGVFDPSSCKIIDYYEFEFNKGQQLKGGEESLQVKDDKIYCLDNLGNLYELGKMEVGIT